MLVSFNENELAPLKGGLECEIAVGIGLAGAVCGNEQRSHLWGENANSGGSGFAMAV